MCRLNSHEDVFFVGTDELPNNDMTTRSETYDASSVFTDTTTELKVNIIMQSVGGANPLQVTLIRERRGGR